MQSRAVYYTVKCISLHSALADGRRSDMDRPQTDNPQVYIRHKDVRPSSHQKNHLKKERKMKEKKNYRKKRRKKCYPLSFSILGGRNSTRALQSNSFQNPGGVPWAWRTKDEGQRTNERTKEILVSNLGFYLKNQVSAHFSNLALG